MKQETKELIDWIKKQINIAKTDHIDKAWNGQHEHYNKDYEKALSFLDSLPEIESHLCRGGYIQDRNGTPCCDGNKVKFCVGEEKRNGTLLWNDKHACFNIVEFISPEVIEDDDIHSVRNVIWFEKVEK